jgi:hypothetical protein
MERIPMLHADDLRSISVFIGYALATETHARVFCNG